MAIFWPFLGKGARDYIQQWEIWYGVSLCTSFEIQEEPKWRTMWGLCFDHKRAMFWPFLGKGDTGYTQHCEIWHGSTLGTLIMIQEEPIWRTMWGPCFGHKRAISKKGDYRIHQAMWNLAWNIPGHIDWDSARANMKKQLRAIFFSHKMAIVWPFIGKGFTG